MKERLQDVRKVRGPKNLSSEVICTTDIFKIQPIFCRETKNGDIFNIEHKQLNICDSLVVPAFVDIKNRNSWFYTPFSKVWQPFETMLGNTSLSMGTQMNVFYDGVPELSPLLVLAVLTEKGYISIGNDPAVFGNYDFRYISHGTEYFARFLPKGRKIWNILQGLGYKFQMHFITAPDSYDVNMQTVGVSPSALPLLAYCKIYLENFVPSKYGDKCNEIISRIYNFHGNSAVTGATIANDGTLITDGISGASDVWLTIIDNCFEYLAQTYYGDDYFTSSPVDAMDTPDNTINQFELSDITLEGHPDTVVVPGSNMTPVHRGVGQAVQSPNPANVSDYIHNMLHIVTKNIQLKALSGSKLAQRLYALYGNKSQTYNMEAVLLDQNVSNLEVRSITSVADTESTGGASLGQKGGQLNGYGEKKFHYEFTEFGVLICVNQIIPTYFYGDGLHREMMHIKADDFYNDRFALAGYQNIARFELFNNDLLGYYLGSNLSPSGTWGKTSAYAEYAIRKDACFGDFNLLSRATGTDAFHFKRELVDQLTAMENNTGIASLQKLPENTEDFMLVNSPNGSVINHQFDRIFTDSDASDDHIAQFNDFRITADRYGRNVNDFTIGESDGHEVEMDGLGKVLYN